tara:strand:- start:1898 stop:2215 length:318 start_codon:yes stop_codon:yes gene_type:complete
MRAMTLARILPLGVETRQRFSYLWGLALTVFLLPGCTIPLSESHALQIQVSAQVITREREDDFDEGYIDPALIEFSPKQAWQTLAIQTPFSPLREPWKQRQGGRK